MSRRGDGDRQRLRARMASEVARLLAEGGEDDPARARRKVAARLGVRDEAALPGGDEIRAALAAHRQLFATAAPVDLAALRRAALAAMEHFSAFDPRLVGPVLDGSAGPGSPVRLHLHADDPDAIAHELLERGVPARPHRTTLRVDARTVHESPCWSFRADGVDFELLQLPLAMARQAPRDPLDDRPLARAGITAVRRLLDESGN